MERPSAAIIGNPRRLITDATVMSAKVNTETLFPLEFGIGSPSFLTVMMSQKVGKGFQKYLNIDLYKNYPIYEFSSISFEN